MTDKYDWLGWPAEWYIYDKEDEEQVDAELEAAKNLISFLKYKLEKRNGNQKNSIKTKRQRRIL